MPRCGCSSSSGCACVVRPNTGATVTGDGSVGDPIIVNVQYSGSGLPVSTMERYEANSSSLPAVSQTLFLTAFTPRIDLLSTGVRMFSGTGAAAPLPSLIRFGVYTINQQTGDGLLVASTPNDNTLFAAANTGYSKNWSTPYQVLKGERYYVGLLIVTAATPPTMVTSSQVSAIQGETGTPPYACAKILGQPDLPSNFIYSQLAASNAPDYARLF